MHEFDVELLPCPFCRSDRVELVSLDWRRGVRCNSCEAQGPKVQIPACSTSWDEPAARWNEYAVNVVEIEKNIKKNKIA